MTRRPRFSLKSVLAFVMVAAILSASLREDLPIGFTIAMMLLGSTLGVVLLERPLRLRKAALLGSLGGILGGFAGGLAFGARESGAFSSLTENAIGQTLSRGEGWAAMGGVIGLEFGTVLGILLRSRGRTKIYVNEPQSRI